MFLYFAAESGAEGVEDIFLWVLYYLFEVSLRGDVGR